MPATLTCPSVLACGWMVIHFHLGASKLLTLWVTCSFLERKKGAEIELSLTLTAGLPGEALLEACGPHYTCSQPLNVLGKGRMRTCRASGEGEMTSPHPRGIGLIPHHQDFQDSLGREFEGRGERDRQKTG